jgi:hypothetical protein
MSRWRPNSDGTDTVGGQGVPRHIEEPRMMRCLRCFVKSVVEKFREKYGAKDVKKYYSKFDVAVLVELVQSTVFRAK